MGGFLYHAKRQGVDVTAGMNRCLEVFEKKRLADGRALIQKERIERDNFVVYLYEKIGVKTENIYHFQNGDFILGTGTFLYRQQTGLRALNNLYAEFDSDAFEFSTLQGHFCIVLFKNGKLHIWNDLFGVYHVFTNIDQSLISSSFLAVVRGLGTRQPNLQAMYEYVFEGASYNDDTYVEGVKLLDAFHLHVPGSDVGKVRKKCAIAGIDSDDFAQRVNLVSDSLANYFDTLKNCFGSRVCSALSGGYDSRLILALINDSGMDPYLYVYGTDQSADVRVARSIAAAENLEIHHDNRVMGKHTLKDFRELTINEYFYSDGHGPNGVFTNGAEFLARGVRTDAAGLQLNGGGGEIFRNFWKLPNRSISINAFMQSRFDRLPESIFNGMFDTETYLSNLHKKIQHMLEIDSTMMTRQEVEELYVYMRVKYWMGYNTSIQNVRSYALIPLTEPVFAIPSFSIPFRQKELGIFEAALIRRLNPRLAGYDSAYGYSFDTKPGLAAQLKNTLELNLPVAVKRQLRKLKYRSASLDMPYYLQESYISSVIPAETATVNRYFEMDNIRDPLMFSRLQTVNLVLSGLF